MRRNGYMCKINSGYHNRLDEEIVKNMVQAIHYAIVVQVYFLYSPFQRLFMVIAMSECFICQ
jgi:hypothetical protein